jgi:hypothetical protein
LKRKDFSAQYLYWTQLCNKNRKAFISGESLSKSLISVLLLKEPHDAPEGGEANGKGLPDSASISPVEAKEDTKEINPPADHPTTQADFGESRESDRRKKPARNSVSSSEGARARSPQIIAESLPLNQPGWSADYSLPTGNASEEAPQ